MTDLGDLTEIFERVAPLLTKAAEVDEALSVVTSAVCTAVPAAESSSITIVRKNHFRTVGATSDLAAQVDAIQYDLGEGPCVTATLADTVTLTEDLANDNQWPRFAKRAIDETEVRSILAFRLFLEPADAGTLAGLNLYSTKRQAFDSYARTTGLVLSTHAALALTSAERQQKITNLERALETSRTIGTAVGILMARHLLTSNQAFDLMRVASQHSHRKIADLALDVIDTGSLDLPTT